MLADPHAPDARGSHFADRRVQLTARLMVCAAPYVPRWCTPPQREPVREESPVNEPRYSIVIPAFNEEASMPALVQDMTWLMGQLDGTCEVLIVDDGSRDRTFALAREAQTADPRFRALRLSRNFGHQVALTAGLARSRGQAVITMDADRQHPVATVPTMIEKWCEGWDVVFGVMTERPSESAFKRISSDSFYKLIDRVSDTPMPRNAGDFRLMDRQVVDALLRMPERNRYIRGMVSWLGFRQIGVPYSCGPRQGGVSSYTVARMVKFATDALLSFSIWPLRAGLKLGFIVSGIAVMFGVVTIAMRLLAHTVPGWATIVVVTSFLGGVQLIVLGVVGEYVGRIYEEVKARPLFVLDDDRGRHQDSDRMTSVAGEPDRTIVQDRRSEEA
jgi:dolichol-phosphate mannosyltransferase